VAVKNDFTILGVHIFFKWLLEAISKMPFDTISALAVEIKSSKYYNIYHARHWLRWRLRFNFSIRLDLEPKSDF